MKKVEMVEKIAAMMNLGTVEAKKVIINAVGEWGLQKSENFYDLLVAGEYDKAASRATVADLKEMEEFIAFYKADEPAQEERTVFFSAQEAHNYQAEKARKANDNQVKAHKVGIQMQIDAINAPAEPVEADPVVDSIVNETRRGFLVLFKEWVITNSTYILKNLHDLDSGMLAVLKISRGDWSVDEYSIRHLGKIFVKAQDELTALQGGAN